MTREKGRRGFPKDPLLARRDGDGQQNKRVPEGAIGTVFQETRRCKGLRRIT